MAKDEKGAAPAAPPAPAAAAPVPNGIAVKAPAGMETISVGGLNFAREGDGFVLPQPLVAAARAHIKSFVDAAKREEARMLADLERLAAEADIPGRIKALEQRLAAIEGALGHGVSRG